MEQDQTPITIRNIRDEDIPAITKIYNDIVANTTATYEVDPLNPSTMNDRLSAVKAAGFPCLVATSKVPEILGYAYASAFRPRPAYRFSVEHSIYVAPNARGRGVGRRLMQALIKECERLGFRQMIAVIGDGGPSSSSVLFHQKIGFKISGTLEGSGYKFGRWLDTVFMQLAIGGGAGSPPDPASLPEVKLREG
ncbi:hypothetical protein VTK26DRAFT_8984 [Humicola hyalothermophila]